MEQKADCPKPIGESALYQIVLMWPGLIKKVFLATVHFHRPTQWLFLVAYTHSKSHCSVGLSIRPSIHLSHFTFFALFILLKFEYHIIFRTDIPFVVQPAGARRPLDASKNVVCICSLWQKQNKKSPHRQWLIRRTWTCVFLATRVTWMPKILLPILLSRPLES